MEIKKTITSIFFVPTLNINIHILNKHGYINGYIKDSMRDEQYEDCVYVLFKPPDIYAFSIFVEDNYQKEYLLDDYDYDEYVVLVFKLNPAFKEDFDLIKKGKYSKTSKKFQKLFVKDVSVKIDKIYVEETSLQTMIFWKYKKLAEYWKELADIDLTKEQEFWTTFEINEETLKL